MVSLSAMKTTSSTSSVVCKPVGASVSMYGASGAFWPSKLWLEIGTRPRPASSAINRESRVLAAKGIHGPLVAKTLGLSNTSLLFRPFVAEEEQHANQGDEKQGH